MYLGGLLRSSDRTCSLTLALIDHQSKKNKRMLTDDRTRVLVEHQSSNEDEVSHGIASRLVSVPCPGIELNPSLEAMVGLLQLHNMCSRGGFAKHSFPPAMSL